MPELVRHIRGALALLLVLALPVCGAAQEGASLSTGNSRLAVTQLATSTGSDVSDLLAGGPETAVYLQSGEMTLSEIAAELASSDDDRLIQQEGGILHLRAPLVVLRGAALTIGPGSDVRMHRDGGAYLVSLGRLEIANSKISVTGKRHDGIDGFNPFIASVGRGRLGIEGSALSGLGYSGADYSSGVFLGGGGFFGPDMAGVIRGTTFENIRSVSIRSVDDAEITGNRFEESRGVALRIRDGNDARIEDNTILGTAGSQAMHFSGLQDPVIRGNRLDGGGGKGLRLDDGSSRAILRGNLVRGFDGTGIALAERTSCVLLQNNAVTANGGSGIKIRDAGQAVLAGNDIRGNRGVGLVLRNQQQGARVLALDNTFADNSAGIRGTQLAELRLARNDLSEQIPRLLSGDLDQFTPRYLRAAKGGSADLVFDGVSVREGTPLRRDAADRAFDTCSQGGRS